ncbi:unnamed protein product (macronuclear) [Paramecium tetraurelia]|uniref:Insulin-like growth factor binding protein, N-terminal n=1 Tax=Paramecium tetraurelia TaxID=5888 RepID=A0EBW5_PARTE|nr:uncharacterized protein GSPATT00025517001 [Paramecium tetraurelia]CAK92782.1 unnamed protein product [Paramecium tetraurelia]|eukprot:XP_001460179.1 hypothetical protein (macronuclear) [Paramecium tetraurelia strain d4-2]
MKTLDLLLYQYSLMVQCFYIWTLTDKQQFYAVSFTGTMQSFEQEEIMMYGIWSRFTPLSTISQTGPIGIFDSHCFHLNSALESENKRINFMYYDCINKEQMVVSKFIQFISKEGKQYKFEIILDSMKYEYYWYFFAIHLQPHQNSFTYYLLQGESIVDIQSLQIQFPYLDEKLIIVFGGSLIIDDHQILQVKDTSKLSYFPGEITLLEHQKGYFEKLDIDIISYIQTTFDGTCQCYENQIKNLVDVDIDWLDYKIFASANENCDTFAFQTWIKVQQIVSDQTEFLYQLFKLSGNFENQQLRDDNLSALQIFYKFSKEIYQIKFTTYSYTIPYYNLDFSKNPFLNEYLYDLPNIYLWQFVTVILKNNIIEMKVTLFEGKNQHIFFRSQLVNQFHIVQYKLQYGNILQSSNNYLKVQLRGSKFFNCVSDDQVNQEINCHFSCKDCDGPTNLDCLSCPETSRRIYIPTHKACICPYDTIDDGDCKDYQSLNLIMQQDFEQNCKQGYFEYRSYCYKCPSIIRDNLITCLECITDPKNWMDNPYCQTNLFLDDVGSPAEFIKDLSQTYYIFDGDNLKACNHKQNKNLQTIDEVFEDYQLETNEILSICSNSKDPQKCLPCNFIGCAICGVISTTQICLQCDFGYDLRDGLCVELIMGQMEQEKCVAPYYITSEKKCRLCQIENCQYCFEYESNDLTYCTLYKDFQYFKIDEFHKVGCALCQEGFIFDFVQGGCHYQKPQTINCLRAFKDLQNREICTLSAVDDFNIAPEIINCQKYISNCKQCYQTTLSVIKCIICEDGYSSSIITGHCQKCNSNYAKYCIEGDFYKLDSWMQLLQSFLMQFLPNRYMYSESISIFTNYDLPIKCMEGYELNKFFCKKYCDSNCSVCKKMGNPQEGFQCAKCFLNYYMEPVRVRDQGKCIACAQLCQVCQPRTTDEIERINPLFVNKLEYSTYTMKCIKSIPHPNIFLDPYIQIAKYCYNQQCNSFFQYQVTILLILD